MKWIQRIVPIGIFACIVGIFFWQVLFSGKLPVPTDTLVGMYHPWRDYYAKTYERGFPFKNSLITDPIRQQIPWRKQVIESFKEKKVPLWDATSFLGAPLLSNIQSGALYPLNIIFFFFPFATAWTILIISQPFLAGIFLYIFLRHKNLDSISSLLGGTVFAFSGFSIAWLTWGTMLATILWLPLLLLSLEKIHQSSNPTAWRVLFIFSFVSAFFAGHIQLFFYCMLVLFAYAIVLFRKTGFPKKLYSMHILIPVIVLSITFPVWFRLFSYISSTSRIIGSSWTVEGFFIPFRHLMQFIAPDFFGNPATLNYWGTWNYGEMVGYVGVVGLLFAFIGISTQTLFWTILVGVSLFFAVDSPLSRLPFMLHIPGVSSLQPTRLLAVVDLGLSILSAYGVSYLVNGEKKRSVFLGSIVLIGIGIVAWMSVLSPTLFGISLEQSIIAKRNLMLPSVFCIASLSIVGVLLIMEKSHRVFRYIGVCMLFMLLSFDLFRFGWKFTPFTDISLFFPETEILTFLKNQPKPYRVIATDDRILPPNTNGYYGIESVGGYDPLYESRYEKFMAAFERGKPDITPPYGFTRIIAPKNIYSRLFPLLFSSYILSFDELSDPNFEKIFTEGTTYMYTYRDALQRLFLVEEVEQIQNEQAIFDRLYSMDFDPRKTALIEGDVHIDHAPLEPDESVMITSYTGDHIEAKASVKRSRFMVIGNHFDLNWRITIDGKKTDAVRADYLYFGCIIPEGNHVVHITYE